MVRGLKPNMFLVKGGEKHICPKVEKHQRNGTCIVMLEKSNTTQRVLLETNITLSVVKIYDLEIGYNVDNG